MRHLTPQRDAADFRGITSPKHTHIYTQTYIRVNNPRNATECTSALGTHTHSHQPSLYRPYIASTPNHPLWTKKPQSGWTHHTHKLQHTNCNQIFAHRIISIAASLVGITTAPTFAYFPVSISYYICVPNAVYNVNLPEPTQRRCTKNDFAFAQNITFRMHNMRRVLYVHVTILYFMLNLWISFSALNLRRTISRNVLISGITRGAASVYTRINTLSQADTYTGLCLCSSRCCVFNRATQVSKLCLCFIITITPYGENVYTRMLSKTICEAKHIRGVYIYLNTI